MAKNNKLLLKLFAKKPRKQEAITKFSKNISSQADVSQKSLGLLVINLGTPENYLQKSVKKYLREFLADKRVIDLPFYLRYILLYAIILPFRTPKISKAYKSIWTKHGSPLRYHSEELLKKLQTKFADTHHVALGMRYGTPSIKNALKQLQHCDAITILPLYPQYSSAATGSSLEYALNIIAKLEIIPNLKVVRDFHYNQFYIKAQAEIIKSYLQEDYHILFSYHGLPERHLKKSTCKIICEACQINSNYPAGCYRAQCYKTTALIAQELNLDKKNYSTAFQSRLGKTEWIKPYTDKVLEDLAKRGIRKLLITCPSFVADCLETLEEIALRAKQDWQNLTGGELIVTPCLNSDDSIVNIIADLI